MLLAIVLATAAQAALVDPLLADEAVSAALGTIDPKPGAWAEYLIRSRGKGDVRMRVTALPSSGAGGYWLEIATAGDTGIPSGARLLLRGKEFSPGAVERAFVMIAGQQPIEIPPEQVRRGERARGAQVKSLGTQRVRVPAGEFRAEALRVSDARVWRAAAVPLWGLVKAVSPRQTVELVASGNSGGHSIFPPGWDQGNGSESRK